MYLPCRDAILNFKRTIGRRELDFFRFDFADLGRASHKIADGDVEVGSIQNQIGDNIGPANRSTRIYR
jgi:hypothetical protein